MKLEQEEIPKLVQSFWKAEFPESALEDCYFLNKDNQDSDNWGAAVYKCESKENSMYVAVHLIRDQFFARKLTEDEINYLLFGTIPLK